MEECLDCTHLVYDNNVVFVTREWRCDWLLCGSLVGLSIYSIFYVWAVRVCAPSRRRRIPTTIFLNQSKLIEKTNYNTATSSLVHHKILWKFHNTEIIWEFVSFGLTQISICHRHTLRCKTWLICTLGFQNRCWCWSLNFVLNTERVAPPTPSTPSAAFHAFVIKQHENRWVILVLYVCI